MKRTFLTKEEARNAVWDALQRERQARFPFPPHGRIPNFVGAEQAARRLAELSVFKRATRIKVSPDAPQLPVRRIALERGAVLYMPTPRLRRGFLKLDPRRIPKENLREAASLSRGGRWAEAVPVEKLPRMGLVVVGSVAITRAGYRCGKGHGYGDLEFAILRELGHPPPPVATTVHPLQVVEAFPSDPHDVPVSVIVTPQEVIEVADPPAAPEGIDWELLEDEDLEAMPVLRRLERLPRRPGGAVPSNAGPQSGSGDRLSG